MSLFGCHLRPHDAPARACAYWSRNGTDVFAEFRARMQLRMREVKDKWSTDLIAEATLARLTSSVARRPSSLQAIANATTRAAGPASRARIMKSNGLKIDQKCTLRRRRRKKISGDGGR